MATPVAMLPCNAGRFRVWTRAVVREGAGLSDELREQIEKVGWVRRREYLSRAAADHAVRVLRNRQRRQRHAAVTLEYAVVARGERPDG